jgi:hypothetical protein
MIDLLVLLPPFAEPETDMAEAKEPPMEFKRTKGLN